MDSFLRNHPCLRFSTILTCTDRGFVSSSFSSSFLTFSLSFFFGSGKTSLLLQFAYNCASQDSSSFVTFICKPHSLDHNPPCLSQGVDPECDAFARITIKYIHDDEELRKYFAAFHVQRIFPRAVIIDDFYDLFNERSCAERFGHIRPRESAMVKTLALCYDAISFANGYGGRGAQCHLLVSDSHVGETPRLRFIYQRWLPQILTIEALDDSSFCVSLGRDEVSPANKAVKATYTLIQGRLQLDCIEVHG
ncbi:hypothetical protein M758_6G211200 [Ceratodon purpureus]|nr:hypothetical protein M758_6G211200 [Ceratodon purpureus]